MKTNQTFGQMNIYNIILTLLEETLPKIQHKPGAKLFENRILYIQVYIVNNKLSIIEIHRF